MRKGDEAFVQVSTTAKCFYLLLLLLIIIINNMIYLTLKM